MKTCYFLILLFLIGLSSCMSSKPNQSLLPASLYSNMKYIPKPFLQDSIKSKVFVSLNYQTFNRDDKHMITNATEFAFTRGHTFKNFQFGYGASYTSGKASYDRYDNTGKLLNRDKSNFNSILLQTSFNGIVKKKNIEYRYLSLDLAYSKEGGNYKIDRANLEGKKFYTTLSNTSIYTIGLSSEIAKKSDDIGLAIRFGLAKNIGNFVYVNELNKTINNEIFPYVTFYLNYKQISVTSELSSESARLGLAFSF